MEPAGGPQGVFPLPTVHFDFEAPAQWRAIDFISDLHLSERLPRTFDAWSAHLLGTTADAVFILGDLFEAWPGDDARSRPFEQRCVDVLQEASSRRQVAFMAGNRDFLVGSAMLNACGMMALSDPTMLAAWGQRIVLCHGDALCIADTAYQQFRTLVRSFGWQDDFLARPLAERLEVVAAVRRQSAMQRQFDGDQSVDIDTATAVALMHGAGADVMVHGHTHRPGSGLLAPGFKRHVLSDWDLDDRRLPRAEVLRLDRDGLRRLAPNAP